MSDNVFATDEELVELDELFYPEDIDYDDEDWYPEDDYEHDLDLDDVDRF